MEFDNTNTGALFSNKDKKTTANHPDYKGTINVNGQEFWLSAWIKPTKKDASVKFMSLSVQPKEAQQQAPRAAPPKSGGGGSRHDEDRDIPFINPLHGRAFLAM